MDPQLPVQLPGHSDSILAMLVGLGFAIVKIAERTIDWYREKKGATTMTVRLDPTAMELLTTKMDRTDLRLERLSNDVQAVGNQIESTRQADEIGHDRISRAIVSLEAKIEKS